MEFVIVAMFSLTVVAVSFVVGCVLGKMIADAYLANHQLTLKEI